MNLRKIALLLTALVAYAHGMPAPQPGDVVFATRFDTPAEQQAWPRADFASWATGSDGSPALCITVPPARAATPSLRFCRER